MSADGEPPPAAPEPDESAGRGVSPLGLDPDLAAASARRARGIDGGEPKATPRVLDTRRYRWMVGVLGLIVVVIISVVSFAQHGVVTAGVPAHHRLRYFAAPLARSNLNGDANVAHPTCSLVRHDPRALNVCLLVKHAPLVLAFFVLGAPRCTREVDAMQAVSGEVPSVEFAAVAINASHSATAKAVRAHGWTIAVAYDADGAVAYQYGVDVCPLVELADRGGIVEDRLIGEHWTNPTALAQRVNALLASRRQ